MRYYGLKIPKGDFEKVTELSIPWKRLTQIPEVVFQLPNLTILNLEGSQISSLPETFSNLENLKELNLGANKLENVENLPPNLTRLELYANQLEAIPSAIFELKKLTFLGCGHNFITKIPAAIQRLKQLRELELHYNRIKTLPAAIGKLTSLRTLSVGVNLISKLPPAIGKCTNLTKLHASSNKLKDVCDELGQCTQLNALDLSGNKLSGLNPSLSKCLTLQVLILDRNKFQHIPECVFSFQWLSKLSFNRNELTRVDLKGISNRLYDLNLDKNRIHSLKNIPVSIEKIQLDENKLTTFPQSLLKCTNLKELYLERNKIENIPNDFEGLKNQLEKLTMKFNPAKATIETLLPLQNLTYLTGLMNKKAITKLLLLLKDIRENGFSEHLIFSFLNLTGKGKDQELQFLSVEDLLGLLNSSNHLASFRVRNLLYKKKGIPLFKNRLKKGAVLGVIGSTGFFEQQLKDRLDNVGVQFKTEIDHHVTHLLVGWGQIKLEGKLSEKVSFLSEKKLSEELWRLEKAHMLKEQNEDFLNSLRDLLMSDQAVNVRLGLELIKNGGLPQGALNIVLLSWLKPAVSEPDLDEGRLRLLSLNVEDEWKFVLKKYLPNKFLKVVKDFENIKTTPTSLQSDYASDIKLFLLKNRFDMAKLKKALSMNE